MTCPTCERYVTIEDWNDDKPFNCPHCNTLLKLVTDEGSYCGASEKSIEIQEDD